MTVRSLNTPSSYKPPRYPTRRYIVKPWAQAIWTSPLAGGPDVGCVQAFFPFVEDQVFPSDSGVYNIANYMDATLYLKQNGYGYADCVASPDTVIPPLGDADILAGGTLLGIAIDLYGYDFLASRSSSIPAFAASGVRGQSSGIYMVSHDGNTPTPSPPQFADTSRVYDTADFLIGLTSCNGVALPATATTLWPTVNGVVNPIQIITPTTGPGQTKFTPLSMTTKGKSQLAFDIDCVSGTGAGSALYIGFDRLGADGQWYNMFIAQNNAVPPFTFSLSCGPSVSSTTGMVTIVGGQLQITPSPLMRVWFLNQVSGGSTGQFTFTCSAQWN